MEPDPEIPNKGQFIKGRDWWNDPVSRSKKKDYYLVAHLKTPNGLLKMIDKIKNDPEFRLPMPDVTKRSSKEMAHMWPRIGWVAIWRNLDEEEAAMMELTISQMGIQEVGVFKVGDSKFLEEMKSNALYRMIESALSDTVL